MTDDSRKTNEPEFDYAPDEEPPEEIEAPPWDRGCVIMSHIEDLIYWADALGLHATITIRITSPDGSVVDVTKQSEMAKRGR